MPSKTRRTPYQYVRYVRFIVYVAKKTTSKYKKGRRVSAAYAKRYPKLVKRQQWMRLDNRMLKWDPVTKKQTVGGWKKVAQERLTLQEIILTLKSVSDRRIDAVLARHQVYHRLWQNERGNIRITIAGRYHGKSVREIIHLGFLRNEWARLHNGYTQFKAWIVASILANIRRRGLRVSNPKESRQRLTSLKQKLHQYTTMLSYLPHHEHHNMMQRIAGVARSIKAQESSKQMTNVTLRIEKLI